VPHIARSKSSGEHRETTPAFRRLRTGDIKNLSLMRDIRGESTQERRAPLSFKCPGGTCPARQGFPFGRPMAGLDWPRSVEDWTSGRASSSLRVQCPKARTRAPEL
jgi:hypothetical protein